MGRGALVAFGIGQTHILLTHLRTLVTVVIRHICKLHVGFYLWAHRTALRQVRQLVVLRHAHHRMLPRKVRGGTMIIEAGQRNLVLVRRQLAWIVKIVSGRQWNIVGRWVAEWMVIQRDRSNRVLLCILRVAVHAVHLGIASWNILELWIFVLLIPINLTVWYLVNTIVRLLFTLIVYFTLVNVVEVLLPLTLFHFSVYVFWFSWLLRRLCNRVSFEFNIGIYLGGLSKKVRDLLFISLLRS